MKKILVFSILILAFSGLCFAQNANNEQRIIGTWVEQDGRTTWVFNANGTLTQGSNEYKFVVTDTQLATFRDGDTHVYIISFSSDGRTLILFLGADRYSGNGNWLIKR